MILKGAKDVTHLKKPRKQDIWSHFRFSVIGQLLASPPLRGKLRCELDALAERIWTHPISEKPISFAFSTIEDWYYKAKNSRSSPLKSLGWKLRQNCGRFPSISEVIKQTIKELHNAHPGWTHQLHYDNLLVLADQCKLGKVAGYATIRRYRNAHGLIRIKAPRNADRAGVVTSLEKLQSREQRTFESTHVLGLIHSDFHHCSRKLLNENGEWVKPVLVAFLDDRSRLICHAQWYWRETAENFVHALCQAFLKRGLPRSLLTDNGSPMTASETTQGLGRLSILHKTTLPYSPQQNGKQESFWGQIEGRLLAMLEGEKELSLKLLNEATIAWVEMDYHRKIHSETGETPIERFLAGPDVSRKTPSPEELRMAFTVETTRSLRRNDCTVSLEGQRYEVPSCFRHLRRISLRYAGWDLSHVLLVNQQSGEVIGRLYPRDLEKNAEGKRRSMETISPHWKPPEPSAGIAPLLKRYMLDYSETGFPTSYIPKGEKKK